MHELYIKWPRGSAHSGQFLEVEKIRRLPRPPAEEVLDVIFPHPDRQEWVADWGLTGGEVNILLGADMIHLFPKLDHTVEKLGLYMSFLTERYIVMGQMSDNAPEEQLEVIRRFSEEHNGGQLSSVTTPGPRSVIMPPRRRPAGLEVTVRGPDRREVTYTTNSAVSGTAPGQTASALPGPHTTISNQMCLQPPCRGCRPHRGHRGQPEQGHLIGPYHWRSPGTQSRGKNHRWSSNHRGCPEARGGWR